MEHTTIKVTKDTKRDLMLFKIHTNAKSLDEVLKYVIEKLKGELGDGELKNISNPNSISKEEKGV